MSKVIYEFHIKKYTVLKLDEMPKKSYHKFLIESDKSFIGKVVTFI